MNKTETFIGMPLSPGMMQTLENIGFSSPTPIQKRSIPELLQSRDLLGQAETGTGKTAAFSIPLIETVDEKSRNIQALVVCPTRELCLQVGKDIKRLSAHTGGINVVAIYGGQAIEQQLKALRSDKPQIVVATPGRLFDHLRRKTVSLSTVKMIVLDEADEMLDMGFREEIEQIFDLLPEENQRIFFSATMPKPIMDLARTYLRDPVIIKTESKNLTAPKISQSYLRASPREKMELLCRVLDYRDPKLAVVFCNAKSTADDIVEEMKNRGFEAGVLHGDLSQNQRDRVMAKFRASKVRVLVATDIAARGIDIDDIELVLNFHLPHDPEDYVHRIGRTGRAGRNGFAVSLVEPRENSRLRKISMFAKAQIKEEEPPTLSEVRAVKMASLFGKIKNALKSDMISEYRAFVARQDLPSDDVAAGLFKMAFEKFDENSQDDSLSDGLRGMKYSGQSGGRRFLEEREDRRKNGRSDRDFGRNEARFSNRFGFNGGREAGREGLREGRREGGSENRNGQRVARGGERPYAPRTEHKDGFRAAREKPGFRTESRTEFGASKRKPSEGRPEFRKKFKSSKDTNKKR